MIEFNEKAWNLAFDLRKFPLTEWRLICYEGDKIPVTKVVPKGRILGKTEVVFVRKKGTITNKKKLYLNFKKSGLMSFMRLIHDGAVFQGSVGSFEAVRLRQGIVHAEDIPDFFVDTVQSNPSITTWFYPGAFSISKG